MEDSNKKNKIFEYVLLGIIIVIILFSFLYLSNPNRKQDLVIHISSGQSMDSIIEELKVNNIIKENSFVFKLLIKLFSGSKIIPGDYLVEKDSSVWAIAWQLSRGDHKVAQIKITFREGITNEEIANLLADKLSGFRKDLFSEMTYDKQGYLFPDTYFFFSFDTKGEIIKKFTSNFDNKIKKLESQIEESNKSLEEIIIMASILEGEANGKEDIDIISGILWKRISLGVPLQVDVDRLTYERKGLPIAPLNNPGLMSINAALNPKDSKYLYYLHDKNGEVHYAVSYEEHKKNINNYLK